MDTKQIRSRAAAVSVGIFAALITAVPASSSSNSRGANSIRGADFSAARAQTQQAFAGAEEAEGGGGRQRCSNRSTRGTYGYTYNGTVIGHGLIAAAGPITFDGQGNVSADYTVSLNGTIFRGSFTGTYAVNADCTASISINLPWLGLVSNGTYVIVNQGKEAFFTGTDPGVVVTGTAKKL